MTMTMPFHLPVNLFIFTFIFIIPVPFSSCSCAGYKDKTSQSSATSMKINSRGGGILFRRFFNEKYNWNDASKSGSGGIGTGAGTSISKKKICNDIHIRQSNAYNRTLADQILWLEQQLRLVDEEKRVLKKRQKQRQTRKNSNTCKEVEAETKNETINIDDQDERILRLANLERLESQKQWLLDVKSKLESLKRELDQKLLLLHSDLFHSKSRSDYLQRALEELEATIQGVGSSSTAFHDSDRDGSENLSRRIQEACEFAISNFWKDGRKKLDEHKMRLKLRHSQEMENERKSVEIAIEKQKNKMRALARATAIRERDLLAKERTTRLQQQHKAKESKENLRLEHSEIEIQQFRKEQEKEKRRLILEHAERKAKEEEERLRIQLERELNLEEERLKRLKELEEDERRRCKVEELERRRIIRQHVKYQEEAKQLRQKQRTIREKTNRNPTNDIYKSKSKGENRDRSISMLRNFFQRKFRSEISMKNGMKKTYSSYHYSSSIENFRRRVLWQPITLPPDIRITTP